MKALLIMALISHLMAANIRYCFEARISGPPSWYEKGCSSARENSGVTFFLITGPVQGQQDELLLKKGKFLDLNLHQTKCKSQ